MIAIINYIAIGVLFGIMIVSGYCALAFPRRKPTVPFRVWSD